MRLIIKFLSDRGAATAIEYAMIAGLISLLIIVGARTIGTEISAKFVPVSNSLS